ncbi:hypothetical protein [Delftia acidovorans]|uniref:hypothetical protein n=1 Tax=Delftia acidovorans TaxID=80866 RepID=UPI0030EB799B
MKEKYLSKRRSLYFGKGAVKIHFDENGLIDLIVVGKGYKGSLNKDIRVGDELRFVSKHFEIEYDSVEELHSQLMRKLPILFLSMQKKKA